jgi:hypothetical protein
VTDSIGDANVHEDYEDYDPSIDPDCTLCGGDGYTECHDPIQCCRRHFGTDWDQFCECSACGGSGLAKDQTLW